MGDAIKWALLGTAIVVLIALVVVLPFNNFINVDEFADTITTIVTVCGSAFQSARGLINCFLTPFGRTLVTGMLVWFLVSGLLWLALKSLRGYITLYLSKSRQGIKEDFLHTKNTLYPCTKN